MDELSDYNRGRVEMALDCDGNLSVCKTNNWRQKRGFVYRTSVCVTNTKRKLLESLVEITGLGEIVIAAKEKGNWKMKWRWRLGINEQRELLPKIKLVLKDEQRVLVLEALYLLSKHHAHYTPNDAHLEQIYKDMRELNRKGVHATVLGGL